MWTGDPDVDALDRYASDIETHDWALDGNLTLAPGTWCPFNSQATASRAELAPALFYWPHVGRYDDVWASFVAQRVMQEHNLLVQYGRPLVTQTRDEHTRRDFPALLRDLDAEMLGLKFNDQVIAMIRDAAPVGGSTTIVDHVHDIHYALRRAESVEPYGPNDAGRVNEAFARWLDACHDVSRVL
jgi:hypothetical protein